MSSRPAAIAWTKRRIRKLGLLMILAVVLSPVASMIVVGWKYFRRTGGDAPPLGPLITSSLLWSVIAIALMAIVAALIARRYVKFARRAGPILAHGIERTGIVTEVRASTRTAGGMHMYKLTLVVHAPDLPPLQAEIEESQGTDLPLVDVNAPAMIWTLDGRSIIGTSGALFETAPA